MINVPLNIIRAAIPCAGVKEARAYLNGARFEYTAADTTLRVISTTGTALSCFSVCMPEEDGEDLSVTIPTDLLKLVAKNNCPVAVLNRYAAGYRFGGVFFDPVEGEFPDSRRIIPTTLSGKVANFDATLLNTAQKALRAFYQSKNGLFVLEHNGKDGAVMHGGEDCAMVVIMPCLPIGIAPFHGFN